MFEENNFVILGSEEENAWHRQPAKGKLPQITLAEYLEKTEWEQGAIKEQYLMNREWDYVAALIRNGILSEGSETAFKIRYEALRRYSDWFKSAAQEGNNA